MYELSDTFELSRRWRNEEPCRCTGYEICQAAGLNSNKAMLAAQLMAFGFANVEVSKVHGSIHTEDERKRT